MPPTGVVPCQRWCCTAGSRERQCPARRSGAKLKPVLPISNACSEKAAEAPALQKDGNPTASSRSHLSKQHAESAQVVLAEPGRPGATLGVSQREARLLLLTEFGTARALSPC